MQPGQERGLILSCSIDGILQAREAVRDRVQKIAELEHEIWQLARAASIEQNESCAAFGPVTELQLHFCDRDRVRFTVEEALARQDRHAWGYLMQRSGLYQFLDATAAAQWTKQVQGDRDAPPLPPFTRENIEATFQNIHEQRAMFLARGIETLFHRLSSKHKTNSAKAFGKKMIRNYAFDKWANSDTIYATHTFCCEMDDLQRFLRILRGLPEAPDSERAYFRLKALNHRDVKEVEFPWFTVRGHLNRTAHVTLKHEEDIDRLNAMLARASGGNAIPSDKRR